MVQNLQCDWLLRVHYNTTMHAVFFLSPVSKTNITKFSVVFTHKSLYNAGNKRIILTINEEFLYAFIYYYKRIDKHGKFIKFIVLCTEAP